MWPFRCIFKGLNEVSVVYIQKINEETWLLAQENLKYSGAFKKKLSLNQKNTHIDKKTT